MKNSFSGNENIYLVSPRLKEHEQIFVKNWSSRNLDSHVFLLSSGTTSNSIFKSYAISKEAILSNAMAVNERFEITAADRWLSSLPIYHIGGLSIYARSFLCESEVVEFQEKWNPKLFTKKIIEERINYLSLVPTQLYDIVMEEISAPDCLKGVFLGGDFASRALCEKATELGWPLLITFGMTELSSQIATSPYKDQDNRFLEVYDIHKISKTDNGYHISSPALFTEKIMMDDCSITDIESSFGFTLLDELDFKKENSATYLKPLGRKDDVFKLSGRLYHLNSIVDALSKSIFELGFSTQMYLSLEEDGRLGKIISVNCLDPLKSRQSEIQKVIEANLSIPLKYFEFNFFESFNKTELGKIKKIT